MKENRVSSTLKSIIYIVLGILLCCSIIDADNLPNWLISISMIVSGSAMILVSLILLRSILSDMGSTGTILLGFGIFFLPALPHYQNIQWVWGIALLMMILGCAYFLEGILRILRKDKGMGINIYLMLFGAAVFALGICLWLIDSFRAYAGLMMGICFIVYGVLYLIGLATHKDILIIKAK